MKYCEKLFYELPWDVLLMLWGKFILYLDCTAIIDFYFLTY